MSLKIKVIFVIIFIILISVFLVWQNNYLTTTTIEYTNPKIPSAFDEFTIVQVSDLHNKKFGKDQRKILNKLEIAKPDIIVITGDLIDRRRFDLETAMIFVEGAIKIAPVYYVAGNHEAWSFKYDQISTQLISAGVNVLDNEKETLKIKDQTIEVLGLMDPGFETPEGIKNVNVTDFNKQLKNLAKPSEFQILLSHRPELFELYANEKIDLIFSGHAHGGQFRLPFIGGIFAPHQGFFPKYTSETSSLDDSTMVVSRGLGNSLIPIRIFNQPEIVKVILKHK